MGKVSNQSGAGRRRPVPTNKKLKKNEKSSILSLRSCYASRSNLAVQIQELLPKAKAGDPKATRKLASVIKPYSSWIARALLASIGKYDDESDPLIVQGDELADGGDYMPDMTAALEKYQQSAKNGNHCGMCRLGCCYAEGKGCYKNKRLAKYWLEKAAAQCEEADEYLDVYKLR